MGMSNWMANDASAVWLSQKYVDAGVHKVNVDQALIARQCISLDRDITQFSFSCRPGLWLIRFKC